MTLLLAVFIVLFAVSNIDLKKAEKLAKYFSKNMIVQGSETDSETEVEGTFNPDEILNIETPENTTAPQTEATALPSDLENFLGQNELNNLNDLKYELDSMFSSNSNSSSISTSVDKRGLVITLNNAILFDSGSAEIKAEQIETLKKIASQVNLLDMLLNYL